MHNLKSLFALSAVGLLAVGCGPSGDDTPSGTPDAGTATPTAESTPTATPTPVTPGPTVAITFTVDTNTTADGTNALASVKEGEHVYIVGDFAPHGVNCWDNPPYENYACWTPLDDGLVLTDNGDGTHSITLNLEPGTTVEYKFVKTPPADADPNAEGYGWSNGIKDWVPVDELECPAYAELGDDDIPTGGLWEIQNIPYTVPSEDASAETVMAEAWRDYAWETYGYAPCD